MTERTAVDASFDGGVSDVAVGMPVVSSYVPVVVANVYLGGEMKVHWSRGTVPLLPH